MSLVLAGCGEDNAAGGAAPGGVATSEAQVATSATPVSTDAPISTITPSSAPTTTEWVNPFSDSEIAERLLLDPDEYGPDWQLFMNFGEIEFDAEFAATIPACEPFVASVFESDDSPNAFNWRWFHAPAGKYGAMSQAVIVFPSDDAAQATFEAMADPAFNGQCLPAYQDGVSGATIFPLALLGESIPALDARNADEIAFRSRIEFWEDNAGTRHGPDSLLNATVRVGRAIAMIETLLTDGSGATINTEEQFLRAIGAFVDRARHALGGVDHV